ncbi:MAG: hypothetical protein HYZ81_00010 [Nitrospinae bacterium]|nr:hypothetical protein [Nitrospinota bacterium]
MRTRLHLKPGQKGTKQLLAQYGDRLVCVRYRYDAQRKKRFKTVELIVAEREWEPPPPRFAAEAIVGVRVGCAEVEVRDQVKQAGGKWNRSRKVWELRYERVVALKKVKATKHLYMDAEAVSTYRCLHLVLDASI